MSERHNIVEALRYVAREIVNGTPVHPSDHALLQKAADMLEADAASYHRLLAAIVEKYKHTAALLDGAAVDPIAIAGRRYALLMLELVCDMAGIDLEQELKREVRDGE